ncbi:DNA polymerase III subunit theta [Escherichia coli]|uniref:DNA polymerase III subunit theta n=1 Tax=Escherichia coli TaxID=562 RepID=A0A485JDZ5_ECOLX|nr:DNA polymerase III subunit theta [Escherichia coli]VDZ08117.1 DNA polymerase III subunit theta [Escherichia coli]VFT68935.1 DNA polymerase III subunit theta [Escherichia coli]
MLKNLAKLDQTEMDKVNVDLAAAGWHLKNATICR